MEDLASHETHANSNRDQSDVAKGVRPVNRPFSRMANYRTT